MENLAQNEAGRPSASDDPTTCGVPPKHAKRRREERTKTDDLPSRFMKALGASTLDEAIALTNQRAEDGHAKRIAARKADELRQEAVAIRDYHALVNEAEGCPIESFSAAGVLASAFGPGDLVRGLLEEILIRARTVEAATTSKMDVGDVLETIEGEMVMLQNRARAALELLRRCGVRELTTEHRAALAASAAESEGILDHAAEE